MSNNSGPGVRDVVGRLAPTRTVVINLGNHQGRGSAFAVWRPRFGPGYLRRTATSPVGADFISRNLAIVFRDLGCASALRRLRCVEDGLRRFGTAPSLELHLDAIGAGPVDAVNIFVIAAAASGLGTKCGKQSKSRQRLHSEPLNLDHTTPVSTAKLNVVQVGNARGQSMEAH